MKLVAWAVGWSLVFVAHAAILLYMACGEPSP